MKTRFFLLFTLFFPALKAEKLKVYLVPGHGSDYRVYSRFYPCKGIDTVHLPLIMPEKNESMNSYARRMAQKIDTCSAFALVGLSLGGMVAVEMSSFLYPRAVVIISSAEDDSEIPNRLKWMKNIPVYKMFSGWFYKGMSYTAQKVFEPDRKKAGELFDSMLRDKDPEFIKRAIHLVVNFEGPLQKNCPVIHIHGEKDNTIPIKNITADYVITEGSHMMLLTKGEEISELINKELEKYF